MNELQRNKLISHKSVLEVLTLFQFIWTENIAVNEVVAELEANIKKIEETFDMHVEATFAKDKQEKEAYLLSTLFEEMDELLTAQLDRLLLKYALSHSDFFHAYGNARTVKNYGMGYATLKTREDVAKINS